MSLVVTVTEVGTQSMEKLLLEVVIRLKMGLAGVVGMGEIGTAALA